LKSTYYVTARQSPEKASSEKASSKQKKASRQMPADIRVFCFGCGCGCYSFEMKTEIIYSYFAIY
jgi:hypothetical protein